MTHRIKSDRKQISYKIEKKKNPYDSTDLLKYIADHFKIEIVESY